MRISTKLAVFFAGAVLVFCAFAAASILQLRNVSRDYDALLNHPVRDMDRARIVQVDFKKQVQEWKDILLRGHDPEDLSKYTGQFHDGSTAVAAEAATLTREVDDAQARELLQRFLNAHRSMNEKYEQAYRVYVEGHADFKAADQMVRGQDRAPTDLFDQVVARLDSRVKAAVAKQESAVLRNSEVMLGLSGFLLLCIGVLGGFTVRSVLVRLANLKAVSDRIARADIEGLAIPISGNDEIGQFGESMKGVYTAIEELLKLASATAAPDPQKTQEFQR